jgi:AcrR family transcriptional regulator
VAQRLVQQHGLHRVTIADIARAMAKGKSLRYYYKRQEEICGAMLDRDVNSGLAKVADAVARATTAEEKVYTLCLTRVED